MKPPHKILLLATVIATVIGAVTALRRAPMADRAREVEIARTNLVLVSGRLQCVGQTSAFTGIMLDYDADGTLRSRSAVSNGLLNGLSQGFHTNGQLQVSEYFRDGVSHGRRTKWYSSGARLSEATVVNGKLQGTFRKWHENGTLAQQLELLDGQPDGEAVSYFPSGYVKARATLQVGKLVTQDFYPDKQNDK